MLQITNLHLQFGGRKLFNSVNLTIKPTDKIGLIGRNGAGKTTLLKLLTGELIPDSGSVEVPGGQKIAMLRQHIPLHSDQMVMREAMSTNPELAGLEEELNDLQVKLESTQDTESATYSKMLTKLSLLHEKAGELDLFKAKAEKILKGLGFQQEDLIRPLSSFSGGWKMRVELAKLLLSEPAYLFLDEPTNYLDIESIIWFEKYLNQFNGSYILISHDQDFLDNCTKKTYDLSNGKISIYNLPYSKAMLHKEERMVQLQSSHANQQKKIQDKQRTIERFRAKATKSSMAKSMEKQLNKIDLIDIEPEEHKGIRIRFNDPPRSGEVVIKTTRLKKSFGNHLVFKDVNLQITRGEKISIVGKNGEGKSTLINIISEKLEPTEGKSEFGHQVFPGYYYQDQPEKLDSKKTVYESLEDLAPAELRPRLRSILGTFLFSGEDIDKKVSVLSGGERSRLAMAALLLRPYNLLILDEPTNHLDMVSKSILKKALQEYKGTVLVISHDRNFLRGLTKKTLELSKGALREFLGDIDYFLDKHQAESFREFERVEKSKKESQVKPEHQEKVDREQLKVLRRKIQYLERDIHKLEDKLAEFEQLMSDPGFFENENFIQQTASYSRIKKTLEEKYKDWESNSESLSELEN